MHCQMIPMKLKQRKLTSKHISNTSLMVKGSLFIFNGCVSISATALIKIWSGSSLSSSCVKGTFCNAWLSGSAGATCNSLSSFCVVCISTTLFRSEQHCCRSLVCRLRGGQGRAVVDENDGIRGSVAYGDDNVDMTAPCRIPETQACGGVVIAYVGENVHSIFLAVSWVDLNYLDHSMQVKRDEVIRVIWRITHTHILVCLERPKRSTVLDIILYSCPPVRHF